MSGSMNLAAREHARPTCAPLMHFAARTVWLAVAAVSFLWAGCTREHFLDSRKNVFPIPESLNARGVENFFQLEPGLYSGSQPEGAEAFAALRRLGIKTIISVDGVKPNVALARTNGLRYAHLPVGYDGITRPQRVRLIEAARTLPGPIYVHCHHGQHRGPAAAAIICLGNFGWSKERASAWLGLAGTSTNYPGLFDSIAQFEMPSPAESAASAHNFPEVAPLAPLTEAMVEIDRHWGNLQELWKAPGHQLSKQPDMTGPHEALLLSEAFHELRRSGRFNNKTPEFVAALERADLAASKLESDWRQFDRQGPTVSRSEIANDLKVTSASCADCHQRFRDQIARQ